MFTTTAIAYNTHLLCIDILHSQMWTKNVSHWAVWNKIENKFPFLVVFSGILINFLLKVKKWSVLHLLHSVLVSIMFEVGCFVALATNHPDACMWQSINIILYYSWLQMTKLFTNLPKWSSQTTSFRKS